MQSEHRAPATSDEPVKSLVERFGSDMSLLVRQEIELAKRELDGKLKELRRQGTLLGAGGAVAYAGALVMAVGIALVLATFMPGWLAFLITGAVILSAGATLIVVGRVGLQKVDPVPRRAVRGISMDFKTIQEAAR